MKISLLGAPGCGKGTQAKKLSACFGIPHISTGDIFRKAIAEGTELGKIAQSYMSKLVPDEIIIALVEDRLKQPDCENGFILDGFPRTVAQGESYLKNNDFDKVIYFDIDEKTVINRILNRRTCKDCGEIYSLDSYTESTCAKCGGELIVRAEDQKIEERIQTFNELTFPLVEFFENKNMLYSLDIKHLESDKPEDQIEEVFNKILRGLGK